MTFSPEQSKALAANLDRKNVKTRTQAGRGVSYIEGWHAIAEANRIFGFDGWDRRLTELKQIGEPREVDGKWRVAYMATVRIVVMAGEAEVIRDGTGYGSGIDKDVGSAHESALKEAETDAMKRALMTFGNPFGLALYDKTQEHVGNPEPEPRPEPKTVIKGQLVGSLAVTPKPDASVSQFPPWVAAKERILTALANTSTGSEIDALEAQDWFKTDSLIIPDREWKHVIKASKDQRASFNLRAG